MIEGLPAKRQCRECGGVFLAIRHDQRFCQSLCRRAWHSWRESRGARAVELLIRWRHDRQPGSLGALAAFADELIRDHRDHDADRGAGRLAPAEPEESVE
jgi:hypothetical protein